MRLLLSVIEIETCKSVILQRFYMVDVVNYKGVASISILRLAKIIRQTYANTDFLTPGSPEHQGNEPAYSSQFRNLSQSRSHWLVSGKFLAPIARCLHEYLRGESQSCIHCSLASTSRASVNYDWSSLRLQRQTFNIVQNDRDGSCIVSLCTDQLEYLSYLTGHFGGFGSRC